MTTVPSETHRRAVRAWLIAVAALIFAMVMVGGATRLTESGLSIVEWQPITGILPPFTDADWQAEFEKYQTIPQFKERNATMTLDEFKVIYWWEWTHRLLGRVIGLVFLLPFLWFLWKGWIERRARMRLWSIFALGALQGVAGWWMVASGLSNRVDVSQYRLSFHLALACVIYAMTLWAAQRLGPRNVAAVPRRVQTSAVALVVLLLCQIYLGAIVAGMHAGLIFNTWPLIDGRFIPGATRLFFEVPWWRNFYENTLTVQFNHRMAAYVIWLVAVLHAIDARSVAGKSAALLATAVTLQAALGITTLIYQAPLGLALLHQAMAMVVLTIAVVHAERLTETHQALPAGRPLAA